MVTGIYLLREWGKRAGIPGLRLVLSKGSPTWNVQPNPVALKFVHVADSPGGLWKHRPLGPTPRNSDSVGLGWEAKNVSISNVPKRCWCCKSRAVCWESLASKYKRGHCNNQLWSLLCAPSGIRVWVSVPAAPLKKWGRTADAREHAHSACWVPHSLLALCTYLLIYFGTGQPCVLGTSQMRKPSHREVKSLGQSHAANKRWRQNVCPH